jgi:hypothetical protein
MKDKHPTQETNTTDETLEPVSPPPAKQRVRVLVGICTAQHYAKRRAAVRETWLSAPTEGVRAVFFMESAKIPRKMPRTP